MNRDEAMFYELLEIDSYPEFSYMYRDVFDYYGANETELDPEPTYKEYKYGGALAMDFTGDAPLNYAGADETELDPEPTYKEYKYGGALAMDFTGDAPLNYAGADETDALEEVPLTSGAHDDNVEVTEEILFLESVIPEPKQGAHEKKSKKKQAKKKVEESPVEEYTSEEEVDAPTEELPVEEYKSDTEEVEEIIETYDDEEESATTSIIDEAIKEELQRIQESM